MIGKQQIECTH